MEKVLRYVFHLKFEIHFLVFGKRSGESLYGSNYGWMGILKLFFYFAENAVQVIPSHPALQLIDRNFFYSPGVALLTVTVFNTLPTNVASHSAFHIFV